MKKLNYKRYISKEQIFSVETKDGKVFENHYEDMRFLSGAYVSDKPVTEDKIENQVSMFAKGGQMPENAIYIKRRDIKRIKFGEDEDSAEYVNGNYLYNGFWIDNIKQSKLISEAKKQGRFSKTKTPKKRSEIKGAVSEEYKDFFRGYKPNTKQYMLLSDNNAYLVTEYKGKESEPSYDVYNNDFEFLGSANGIKGGSKDMQKMSLSKDDFKDRKSFKELYTKKQFDVSSAMSFKKGGVTSVMTFEQFKKELPEVSSPFFGERGVKYKAKRDVYSGLVKYFKNGRRNSEKISIKTAYEEAYLEDVKLGTSYAKGGEIIFVDPSDHKSHNVIWTRKDGSVGAFAHTLNGRYVGDYYLFPLDDFDKKYYAKYIKDLKDGEILFRCQSERRAKQGGQSIVKANLKNGRIYFLDFDKMPDDDDKVLIFDKSSADVNFLSINKKYKYEDGGELGGKTAFDLGGKTAFDYDIFIKKSPLIQISKDDFLETYNVSYFLKKEEIPNAVSDILKNRKSLTGDEALQTYKDLKAKNIEVSIPLPFKKGGVIDLFEDYESMPKDLNKITSKYLEKLEDEGLDNSDLKSFLKEVEAIGYTFDYGLDFEPYGLRKKGVLIKNVKGFEDAEDDNYAKGGVTKGKTVSENFNIGDKVKNVEFWKNQVLVEDKSGKAKRIDLNDGERISLNAKGGQIDTVTVNVPLLIRLMEFSKEDAKSDLELHKVAEKLTKLSIQKGSLTMADYMNAVAKNNYAQGGNLYTPNEAKKYFSKFKNGGETSRKIVIVNDGEKFNKKKYKAIYEDYDKDGLVNIDDANPTDKTKHSRVEQVQLRDTFDKLLNVKAELDTVMHKAVDTLDKKAPKDADIYARTKTPYSILKKLVEKRMLDPDRGLTDMIGTTIAVENQAELEQVRDDIDGGLLGKILDKDDYYKSPKAGYRAYHYIVEFKNVPVEVQLKTKRQKQLHEISHEYYKKGTLDPKGLNEVSLLFEKADRGNDEAKKEVADLLKNKSKLGAKVSTSKMNRGGNIKSKTGRKIRKDLGKPRPNAKHFLTTVKEKQKVGEKWRDAIKRVAKQLKAESN